MSYLLRGDQVIITPDNVKHAQVYNRNRCRGVSWVSDEYMQHIEKLAGVTGAVMYTHPPGYEVTARFGEQHMHLRAGFATRLLTKVDGFAIVYPSVFKREEVLRDGSLFGLFRVVDLTTGEETSLYSEEQCRSIIQHQQDGALKGSWKA